MCCMMAVIIFIGCIWLYLALLVMFWLSWMNHHYRWKYNLSLGHILSSVSITPPPFRLRPYLRLYLRGMLRAVICFLFVFNSKVFALDYIYEHLLGNCVNLVLKSQNQIQLQNEQDFLISDPQVYIHKNIYK